MRNLIIDYEKLIFRHTTFIKNLYVERLNVKGRRKSMNKRDGNISFKISFSIKTICILNEMQDIDVF